MSHGRLAGTALHPGRVGTVLRCDDSEDVVDRRGQSATGALIDHVIENHAYAPQLKRDAAAQNGTIYELLNQKVIELKKVAHALT